LAILGKCDNISNFQISKALNKYDNFRGVFPIDMLPDKIHLNEFGVINTGHHWAAYFHNDKRSEYFDPFGSYSFLNDKRAAIPRKIVKYLRSNNPKQSIVYNNACIQNLNSQKCGCFAIKYIQLRQSGLSAEQTLKQFSEFPSNKNEQLALTAY
jgi:hypothetical protein